MTKLSVAAVAIALVGCGADHASTSRSSAPDPRATGSGADSSGATTCSRFRNQEVCCPAASTAAPRAISTPEACEKDPGCSQLVSSRGVDLAASDVVLISPAELGAKLSFEGPPTTLGDEWRVYIGLRVTCQSPGDGEFPLELLVSPGGGDVTFAAVREKRPDRTAICFCRGTPRQGQSTGS